jgi:ArsR family transcriptional regulator, arsenate/arsenite/antimonite-responsive transcriptional repressor
MRIKQFTLGYGVGLFSALADESRIRLVSLIYTNEEMTAGDLELILDFSQTKTSRLLNKLKNAGILTARRIDQWVLYAVADELTDIIGNLLALMERDALLLQDQDHFRILYSNRELALNKLNNRHYSAS